jgi:phenylacetate-CoA ligase
MERNTNYLSPISNQANHEIHVTPFSGSVDLQEYYIKSRDTLDFALNETDAYQSWRAFDPGKGCPIDERYSRMPVLTKKEIRDYFPRGFVPRERDVESGIANREIEFVKTSGSTGDSVTNIWNQKWWNNSERESWRLNAHAARVATGDHQEAILANPLNVGFISDNVELSMKERKLSRFLYLNEKTNPLTWTPEHMDRMIGELEAFKPVILEANPSLLAKLSRYITAFKKKVYQPELIVLTYEYPSKLHDAQIRKAFGTPIASSYGTTEVGYVFMQCEEGKFHQNSKSCRVDFQPLKPEHGGPGLARILVTTFDNPWYVIVRFDVGDLVHIDKEQVCSCGRRSGWIISSIEGRSRNITLTCEGRVVTLHELDEAISSLHGIDEYQLTQISKKHYNLDLVSQRTDKEVLDEEAKLTLSKLYGEEARFTISFKENISPSSSGKYSLAQTLLNFNIEDFLDERYVFKDSKPANG